MRRVDNRGSITVEATISLVTFFLTIVSVLSMISICRVQYCIGRALKAAALMCPDTPISTMLLADTTLYTL